VGRNSGGGSAQAAPSPHHGPTRSDIDVRAANGWHPPGEIRCRFVAAGFASPFEQKKHPHLGNLSRTGVSLLFLTTSFLATFTVCQLPTPAALRDHASG
jgi:hypothetical protein